MQTMDEHRAEVTGDDVDQVIELAVSTLGHALNADWSVPAGGLDWDCRTTVQHIASDLVAYAGQLTAGAQHAYVPFDVVLEDEPEPAGLLSVLLATGGILSAVVRTAPANVQVWHPYGLADRSAVAAMGVVETVVHTDDICRGLSLAWQPPEDLCARVLDRLFPDAPADGGRWATLLWATGRISLPGRPRRATWRWHNERA